MLGYGVFAFYPMTAIFPAVILKTEDRGTKSDKWQPFGRESICNIFILMNPIIYGHIRGVG